MDNKGGFGAKKAGGYDPYVKKTEGMSRYDEKRTEEVSQREKAAQERREIFGGIQ